MIFFSTRVASGIDTPLILATEMVAMVSSCVEYALHPR